MSRILVVEDEKKTASFIRRALETEGYSVDLRYHGDEAMAAAAEFPYDAIVLDIMLPGRDGISILKLLRASEVRIPVLLLTARGSTAEKVEGLDAGADDYLPKPFALEELLARVRALVRRGGETVADILQAGDLFLDVRLRAARRGKRKIELSPREFRLLHYLLANPGKIQGREMLLHKVWDYNFDPGTNLVDVTVGRLRRKIDTAGETKLIHTVPGVGYLLTEGNV